MSVKETVLDNGLKVLIQEVHTAPLASVWCWYRVGSKDERPGLTGVSHWCEHMNFKGTRNISRDQVKGIIEKFGGSWNGYTWLDQTTYLETASTDALDRMLFIEAERMDGCLYDPADCESERTVIISELQGGENDPEQLLDTEVTATAFKVHPYHHPTIGWQRDLETMTRDDLYGHYRRYYVPSNATLVVVGDVNTDDTLKKIERHFGPIPSGSVPGRVAQVEPEQQAERRVVLRKPGTTAYFKASFHAPAFEHADFFPLLVADAVLNGAAGLNIWSGGGVARPQRSARLYRALVDKRLASSVSGALMPTQHPYLYSVHASVADGQSIGRRRGCPGRDRAAADGRDHRRRIREGPDAAPRALRLRRRQRDRHCPPDRLLRDHRVLAGLRVAGGAPRCGQAGTGARGGDKVPRTVESHHWLVRTGGLTL